MNPKIEKLIKTRDRAIAAINKFREGCEHTIKVHLKDRYISGEYPSDPDITASSSECQECGEYFCEYK